MQLIDLATLSRKHFFFFIKKCNDTYRSGHDLAFYRKLITMHRRVDNLEDLIKDNIFLETMYATLEKWNMNQRRARLANFHDFKKFIISLKNSLVDLYNYKLSNNLDSDNSNIINKLEKIFCNIIVMESKRRIGVSKILHFLLPDLIMPIDGKYSLASFFGFNKFSSLPKVEFKTFRDILR
jgi:hypothetical protein